MSTEEKPNGPGNNAEIFRPGKKAKNRPHSGVAPMSENATAKPKEGTIERIAQAQSPEEVAALVAHAVGFQNIPDAALRRINRAAVRRNKELSRP